VSFCIIKIIIFIFIFFAKKREFKICEKNIVRKYKNLNFIYEGHLISKYAPNGALSF